MKISKQALTKAVERKLIEAEQLDPLYEFLLAETSDHRHSRIDDHQEPLRFIRSFGDVFISIGIIFLVIATQKLELSGLYNLLPVAGLVLLSEWLVRRRKLVLPGMVMLLAILYLVNQAIAFDHHQASLLDLGLLSLTSLLFYVRYRMPFSLLPFTAGLVAIAISQLGVDAIKHPSLFAFMGAIIFIIALWLDSLDTRRRSHLSDSAFWLHLLAAPLIVHGVMVSMLTSEHGWLGEISAHVLIFFFFVVFFLLALLIDRRAILVSTQLYMIYALTQVFIGAQGDSENSLVYVLLVLGLFVIYFGTYWYKTRRLIYGFLANSPVNRLIPDVMYSPDS